MLMAISTSIQDFIRILESLKDAHSLKCLDWSCQGVSNVEGYQLFQEWTK